MLSNNPPDMTVTLGEVVIQLNSWLADHPVISTEDEARDAKVLIDRAKLGIKDLEDERDRKVRPLNNQVAEINAYYRPAKTLAEKVLNEIRRRITDFIAKEEAKRIKIAEEARKLAEAAERQAREAEEREKQASQDADIGVVVDVAQSVAEADEKFTEYQAASRKAALAEREAKVKIGGGFTRSLSLRTKESLIVKDAISAINAIGMTPDIEAAIIKGARAFRSMHGELPNGVESIMERSA